MNRRPFCAIAVIFAFTCSPVGAVDVAAASGTHVLLITIDGFPAYLLNDLKTSVPTLRALARDGAVAEGMRVSNPSVTWPNHTTLVTGVRPARHSVLANGVLARHGPGQTTRIEPGHDQADLVAVLTVFDMLHNAGFSTAGINWPCTRNSPSLDVNFPDVPEQIRYMTPSLREAMVAAGSLPDATDKTFSTLGAPGRDRIWLDAACRVIREQKPNFMLFHLLNVDGTHHKYGPLSMASQTAAAFADDCIRDLLHAIDSAGIREQTTIFIVADHGFSIATKEIYPNVIFRTAGLLAAGPTGIVSARVHAISEGGSALVYFTDAKATTEDRQKVLELLKGKEGFDVIEPREYAAFGLPTPQASSQAPDLFLAAKDGYAFDGSAGGNDAVGPAIPNRHAVGYHGYRSDNPKMNAVFIASGSGIAPGTRIGVVENVDVTPTIAKIFGKEMPGVEGRVLTEIFSKK